MNEIIQEVAKNLGLPVSTVEKIVKTYFNFIRFRVSKIPYRNLTTFEGVKTNFLLIGFGKLVVKQRTEKRLQNEKRFRPVKCKSDV